MAGSQTPAPPQIPTLDLPGHRAPAPGGLGLVQAFLNTADLEGGTDELGDPGAAADWFAAHGLPVGRLTERDRTRAVETRETLRAVLIARDDPAARSSSGTSALAALEAIATAAPLRLGIGPDGTPALVPVGDGMDRAIAAILAEVARAATAGTWHRLKVCRNHTCRWSFYDASRNRSGQWCTMAVCGNRLKGRAFRARRRGDIPV